MLDPMAWIGVGGKRRGAGRLNVLTKLGALGVFAILAVLLDNVGALGVVAAISAVALLSSRPSAARLRLAGGVAALTVWGMMLGQAIFYAQLPRTVVVRLVPDWIPVLGTWTGGINLYGEGFVYGLMQSLRAVTVLAAGLTLCWTTDGGELLVGMRRLRVPYGLAFMTVTALRFLPLVFAEVSTVLEVTRLRGGKLRGGHRGLWRTWLGILRAIFANAIRRASMLALSVRSRAFDPGADRSAWRETALGVPDKAVLGLLGVILLMVAANKLLFWAYVVQVYYNPLLRPVYDLTRRFL